MPSSPDRWRGVARIGAWLALLLLGGGVAVLAISTWERHRPAPAVSVDPVDAAGFCVDVLNGNGRRGEAREVASTLRQAGFRVNRIDNAERFDYPRTVVVDRTGTRRWAEAVARTLGAVDVVLERGQAPSCSLVVILGHDWTSPGGF